jgi:hypothetical protein
MFNGAISTSQLPEVFEEEEEESSNDYFDSDNRSRNRHDSGIDESYPFRQRWQRRQRYNSSSIRRTQVTSFVSDYIERRGSAQNMPVGPGRDEYCIRRNGKSTGHLRSWFDNLLRLNGC